MLIHEYYGSNLELSETEIIDFANSHSHLNRSKIEQQVTTWKLKHILAYKAIHKGKPQPTQYTLSTSWFNSFVKRNSDSTLYTMANNVAWN